MELLKDSLLVIGRVFTIIPFLLFVALFMGRRSVGELPVFDFLIIIILGSVVGADIADPNIAHIPTIVAIVAIGLLQKIVSKWSMKSKKIERIVNFEPIVVIQAGDFIIKNLKKIEYTVDNVLELLREQNVFDISEVETGIIEANGKLTVYKKHTAAPTFSYPVVIEGRVFQQGLKALSLTEDWLNQQLTDKGFSSSEVFFASVNNKKELHVSPFNYTNDIPPIYH